MEIKLEDITPVQKRANVSYKSEDVEREVKSAYRDFKKNFIMKGFRPGRVPLFILKARFGRQIEKEVGTKMVNEAVTKITEDYNVDPLFDPEPDEWKLEPEKDFTFTLEFEVKPVFDPADYLGIEARIEPSPPLEEKVEEAIEQLRERYAKLVPVEGERSLEEGDYATVNILIRDIETGEEVENSRGGQLLFNPRGLKYDLFNDMKGMKKGGKREVERDFPNDFGEEKVRGRHLLFTIEVEEIMEKVYPELDDDFARQIGMYGSYREMEKSVREEIKRDIEEDELSRKKEACIRAILECNPFPVPERTIEKMTEARVNRLKSLIKGEGVDEGGYEPSEEEVKRIRERSDFDFRREVLLEAIAKKEGIEASGEDLENYFKETAASLQGTVDAIKGRLLKEKGEDEIKRTVTINKTLDFIVGNANIITEGVKVDEKMGGEEGKKREEETEEVEEAPRSPEQGSDKNIEEEAVRREPS